MTTPAPRRRFARTLPGIIALIASLVGLGFSIAGIALASPADATETAWAVAVIFAWVANILTALGAFVGLVAIVTKSGRWWGFTALVIGVLSNPWLQLTVFGLLR